MEMNIVRRTPTNLILKRMAPHLTRTTAAAAIALKGFLRVSLRPFLGAVVSLSPARPVSGQVVRTPPALVMVTV